MTTSIEQTKVCPSCGLTLAIEEKSCPQCGIEIADSREKQAKAKRKPSKVNMVECPHCGELISTRSKKCSACRTSLKAGFYKVPRQSVDKEIFEPAPDFSAETVTAPMIKEEPSASVVGAIETAEPTISIDTALLEDSVKNTNEEIKTAEKMASVDSVPAKESSEAGSVAEVPLSEPGFLCESIVAVSSKPNLACILDPIEIFPPREQERPPAEPSKTSRRDGPRVRVRKTENRPPRPMRKRRLKSDRLPIITISAANDAASVSRPCNVTDPTMVRR